MEISVICPTFNSAEFIDRTLASVLAQTFPASEVVVADDGSTDDTADQVSSVLRGSPISWRILREEHAGPGATRNAAILAATRPWVAFIDSDDLWHENKLARVAATAARRPTANFFCHFEEHCRLSETVVLRHGATFRSAAPLGPQLFRRNFFSTSAVVCGRELLLRHGLFDPTLSSGQDYELWLRLSPYIRVEFIPEVLGTYVDRPGNISSRRAGRRLWNLVRILHRHRRVGGLAGYVTALSRAAAGTVLAEGRRVISRKGTEEA